EKRLRFLSTVARLWEIAARHAPPGADAKLREVLGGWWARARENHKRLLALLDAVHDSPIPQPLGTQESLLEYDRRRVLKEQLLEAAIGTCLDTALAVRALQGTQEAGAESETETAARSWEPLVLRLEQALMRGDAETVRRGLPAFLERF